MKYSLRILLVLLFTTLLLNGQDQAVLIPTPVTESPLKYEDSSDLFGKSYRWFLEGNVVEGTNLLREVIGNAGFQLDPNKYYVVVANFTDNFSPIGILHGEDDFLNTRLYGLGADDLYFIMVTRRESPQTYVSTFATAKASPSMENLLPFLSLFIPIIPPTSIASANNDTWVDVRKFTIPEPFRKNSDLSFLVKKDLGDDHVLAQAVFDNTSRERWTYGIATAITSANDVNLIIGSDGSIIVEPKPDLDLANFAIVNYHFSAIDTKSKRFQDSFHLLAGIRLTDFIEPVAGIGAGFDLGAINLGLFAGYSVEVANELEDGFAVGDVLTDPEVDPFKTTLRGKLRFGLHVSFP